MSSSPTPATRRQKIAVATSTIGVLGGVTVGSWLMIDGTIDIAIVGGGSIPAGEDCPSRILSPVVPERVPVQVLNATNEPGLAGDVAEDLTDRDFRVEAVDNDYFADTGFEAIIRAGERGLRQAYTVQHHIPGALVDVDDRDDFTVDVVLGSEFAGLQDVEEIEMEPGRLDCAGSGR
ncbi:MULTISPECIES: LytR C-terminal domain-containing protein [Actinomycetes]|uniref:LytR/CpsA/Psr regulator C-terminal domain-containing protein n=2 Tax=Actinomycetes TaxID=1760 RepID=A0ABP6LYH3_9MICC